MRLGFLRRRSAAPLPPLDAFAGQPWRSAAFDPPPPAAATPTMLSAEEGRFLHWLARDYATGAGAICDLGCFAGGSTARLAAGQAARLEAEGGRAAPIHAFDHFTISEALKAEYLAPAGVAPFEGRDMRRAVAELLAPWTPPVRLRPGDIRTARWRDGPIEILFIDAAKLPETADRIAETFFPHLIPGRSIIVQQDYFHWRQPWLPAQMERFGDRLALAAWCESGTAAFRLERPIGRRDLRRGRVSGLSDAELIDDLAAALRRFPGRPQTANLARAIMGLRDHPGVRAPHVFSPALFTEARIAETIATCAAAPP